MAKYSLFELKIHSSENVGKVSKWEKCIKFLPEMKCSKGPKTRVYFGLQIGFYV